MDILIMRKVVKLKAKVFFPLFLVKEKISGLRHFWVENISDE